MTKLKIALLTAGVLAGISGPAVYAAATTLPPEFGQFDVDSDQQLSLAETLAAFPDATAAQIDQADVNGNGMIDNVEFKTLADLGLKAGEPMAKSDDMAANSMAATPKGPLDFTAADADGDQQLDLAEALLAVPDLTATEFEKADVNGNDKIDNVEFKTLTS